MTPNEKAIELVGKFKNFVYGYVGSSMLTNTEYPEQILSQAKKCALIAVEEILNGSKVLGTKAISRRKFWHEVKQEIEKL